MTVYDISALQKSLRDLLVSDGILLDSVRQGEESLLLKGSWDGIPMVFKLMVSDAGRERFLEAVYARLNTCPFPEYVLLSDTYQVHISFAGREWRLVAYRYINEAGRTDGEDTMAEEIASALFSMHRNKAPKVGSLAPGRFFTSRQHSYANALLDRVENSYLASYYRDGAFLRGDSLLHGDFRLANLLLGCTPVRVIDLEDAMSGPREYDLGRFLQSVLWEAPQKESLFRDVLKVYEGLLGTPVDRASLVCSAILRLSYRLSRDREFIENERMNLIAHSFQDYLGR